MNARKIVIDSIEQSIQEMMQKAPNSLRTSFCLPEVMLPHLEYSLPRLEEFMNPPPDVEGDDDYSPRNITQTGNGILLGVYFQMRSPGILGLYRENLEQFFWRLTQEISHKVPNWRWSVADLNCLAQWVVEKTYWHERFHHSMDILRHLYNVKTFNTLHEEALAVAYSRFRLCQTERKLCEVSRQILWDEFINLSFQYTSPGYCDWRNFADKASLKTGVSDYLRVSKNQWLKTARVPVADMIFAMLPVNGGLDEMVM